MIFTFILPCEQNRTDSKNILINFLKTLIKEATINFNKEQLKPKNHF